MARSLGDHVCSRVGVIATPEVKSFETTADDALIVIASDGVWEFLENDEVIAIVSQHSTAQQARAARGPSPPPPPPPPRARRRPRRRRAHRARGGLAAASACPGRRAAPGALPGTRWGAARRGPTAGLLR